MALVKFKSKSDDAEPLDLAAALPELAGLQQRRAALAEENDRLNAEAREIGRREREGAPSAAIAARATRIAALVGDEPPVVLPPAHDRLAEIARQQADAKEALSVLDGRIREAKVEASRIICGRVAPKHRALVQQLAAALRSAHAAALAYDAFGREMTRAGVMWGMLKPGDADDFLGGANQRNGELGRWFRSLVKDGHIGESDVPEEFR